MPPTGADGWGKAEGAVAGKADWRPRIGGRPRYESRPWLRHREAVSIFFMIVVLVQWYVHC
jgi:hypothetical protein